MKNYLLILAILALATCAAAPDGWRANGRSAHPVRPALRVPDGGVCLVFAEN